MSFEDEIAAIQQAVESGQMSAREGVALAQKKRQAYNEAANQQTPFGTAAGAGLGAAAGAMGVKPGGKMSPLAMLAGAGLGGLAGNLIANEGNPMDGMDTNSALGAALGASAAGGAAGRQGMGLATTKALAPIMNTPFGPGSPGVQPGLARNLKRGVPALAAGLGGLAGLAMTQDSDPDQGGFGSDVAQAAGVGAGGAAGGILASLLGKKLGIAGKAPTVMGATAGAAAGDALAASANDGERWLTPEVMGGMLGSAIGMKAGGVKGSALGTALGAGAGAVGGDLGALGAAGAGALALPGGRAMAKNLFSKVPGAAKSAATEAADAATGGAKKAADWAAEPLKSATAGATSAGNKAKKAYADTVAEAAEAVTRRAEEIADQAAGWSGLSKAAAGAPKKYKEMWAQAVSKHPEHFAAMSDKERAAAFERLIKGGDAEAWFKGRYGV